MRRAWRRSARILARVVLPTRSGPSMTMKRGDCGPRSGCGARLAAVDSLAAISSKNLGGAGVHGRDYSRVVLARNEEKQGFSWRKQSEGREREGAGGTRTLE